MDFDEDGAIATTARIPTGNSKFSSFTGNLRNSSYSKSGSFSRGLVFAFLAQRNHAIAIPSRHSTQSSLKLWLL